MCTALWSVILWPFRLVGWAIEWVGRFVGVAIGFVLMVVGVALSAATLWYFGLPLFVVGLLIAMKALQ